jgi:hypothetical protein
MQKIITYFYKNRIEILADIAGFNVEYTNVYQRNVKIYSGIDNTLEFDIKNADQKRIDLTTFSSLSLNIMDAAGNGLPNSPYTITPLALKGISSVSIPAADVSALSPQIFRYSISGIQHGKDVLFYCDSIFGALGMVELVGSAVPTGRTAQLFDSFSGEIDYMGNVLHHSSAIPSTFYEAIPTTNLSFAITCTNFIGSVYLEATTDRTISVESFRFSPQIHAWSTTVAATTTINFNDVPVGNYCYFRVVWHAPLHGFSYGVQSPYNIGWQPAPGTVDTITVN